MSAQYNVKKLERDLRVIQNEESIPGVTVTLPDENRPEHWKVKIKGPEGTPYEGGTLQLDVIFPQKYPHDPPEIAFNPIPYHINIDQMNGQMPLDTISRFSPLTSMQSVINEIIKLIKNPHPGISYSGEVVNLFMSDINEYNKRAAEWTKKYAQ